MALFLVEFNGLENLHNIRELVFFPGNINRLGGS